MNSRVFQLLAVFMILAVCVSGAFAEQHKSAPYHIAIVQNHHQGQQVPSPLLTANLYGTAATFVGSPYADAAAAGYNPLNATGADLWPCFGSATDTAGTNANPYCASFADDYYVSTSGSPTTNVYIPGGAAVLGTPSYTWSLTACDASTTADTFNFCGQTNTWYEDDTGDSADELTYSITAQQGTTYVSDSGTVVFGPNGFGGASPAANVVIYGDANFGTDGVATGPNNGNCSADFGYPLTAGAWPGSTYVIAAGKTCKNPTAGTVSFVATTEVATPVYTESSKASVCLTTPTPCWTVKFTKKYALTQKFSINLE